MSSQALDAAAKALCRAAGTGLCVGFCHAPGRCPDAVKNYGEQAAWAIAAYEAALWRPIDTAPTDRTWVMCWGPDCSYGVAKFYPNTVWAEYPEYTHWRELQHPAIFTTESGND